MSVLIILSALSFLFADNNHNNDHSGCSDHKDHKGRIMVLSPVFTAFEV